LSWLKHFLSTYPDSQVFVASPTRGSGSLIELGFIISEIMPWRIGQATKLADLWKETIRSGEQFDLESYWQPGQLALETTQRLQLALHPDKNDPMDPPRDRSRMFEALFRQMLFRIARDPEGSWLAPAARDLWQKMAYQLLTKPSLFMTEDELTLLIEDILVHFNQKVGSKSIARLKETVTSGDLFVSYGERRFGFVSPVWRDFFATHYLVQVGRENEVLANLNNPFWSGVLRFYVGKVGGEKLVTTLLENGSSPLHEHLFQIANWLPEACDKLAWRKEVLVRLGRLIISDNVPVIWRQRATLALALTEEPGVGALLDQLIHQENPDLRQVIPAAIAKVNKDAAVTEGAVIQALLEPDEPLSWAAAEGLALNGTIDSYAILREAIEDEVLGVRRAAVQGLSLLDEPWSFELLKRASIKDDQPVVKIAANEALQKMTLNGEAGKWQAPQPGDQAWLVSWAVEKGRMVPVGEAALPLVLEALEDGEPKVRANAALTLAQVSAPEVSDPLMKALKDPDILVRTAAFAALCELDRAWDVNGSLFPTG
jgi:HEAT repeat protein